MLTYVIIVSLVVSAIFVFILYQTKLREYEQKIAECGKRLNALRRINAQYQFSSIQREYTWRTYVNTRKKCETFDLDSYFDSIIVENYKYICQLVETARTNSNLYNLYQEEIQNIPSSALKSEARALSIPYDKYNTIENRLISANMLHPVTSPSFECRVIYNSPAGRSHLEKSRRYTTDQFVVVINWAVRNKKRQDSIENQRRTERSKMSNSIRYDVLKRDGFRCRICGRGAEDGVKLHVDHIIPVSKGGKTEYSNLRTLCELCNIGKRDKYDPDGIN